MTTQTALFALLIFVANAIQAITGFGGGVFTMPFAMPLVGRQMASAQMNALGLFVSVFIAVRERAHVQWRQLAKIVPLMAAGVVAGGIFGHLIVSGWLLKFYGLFIMGSAAFLAFAKQGRQYPLAVDVLLLFFAGVIHALFVSGGPLLVVYAMGKIGDKAGLRATLNAVWALINIVLAVQHLRAGLFTPAFFAMFAWLFPAMLLGMLCGYLLHSRVSQTLFLRISYVLLAFIGLFMLF